MFAEIHKSIYNRLPFVLTTLGEYTNQPPTNRPNGFPYHEFIWIKEGCGIFRIGGGEYLLEAGEGMFIRAGVPHSYEGKHFHTFWCTFTIPSATLDYLGVGDHLRFTVPPYLNREAEQLLSFANGDSTPLSRSAAGYSFVMELFSTILAPSDCLSTRVLHLLEQKYSEPLTLLSISEELHVDKFALCRIYKRERGVTIIEDLNRIRIAKAKHFLKYGNESVETVGRMCGFETPSYFGKRFREATGTSPAEYRKTIG